MTDSILYTPSCSVNNRQTDRKADNRRCDGRCTTHTLLLREQHTDKETDKQIGRQMNRQFAVLHRRSCSVNRQTDRHRRFVTVVALHTLSCSVNKALTDRQTDRQTHRQTDDVTSLYTRHQQQHVKDPGHYAESAGGRFHLNTRAPFLCGFATL